MIKIDPEVWAYMKSARTSTTGALAAMKLANIRAGDVVALRPTDEGRDVLYGVREVISDLQSAKGCLDWYIDGHAGEVEE